MDIFASIWSVFWTVFVIFAFVSYLIALFSVIGDLFRDTSLNGWFKAIWLVFLFFVPFLTVLVYLIVRGKSMALRQNKAVQQATEQTESYIRSVANASPAEAIAQAKDLLDNGTISAEEFEVLKSKALA